MHGNHEVRILIQSPTFRLCAVPKGLKENYKKALAGRNGDLSSQYENYLQEAAATAP